MKTFLSIAIFIFTSNLSYSQDGSTFAFSPELNIYGNNYLNGPAPARGNTGISSCSEGISEVFINPASFNVRKKLEFSFQYNYKTTSSYVYHQYKDPYDLYKQQFPSMSAAAGYKINEYVGLGVYFNNPISMYNDEGSGYINILTIQTLGIPICFSLNGFHIGVSLEYTYYYASQTDPYYNKIYHADAEDFNVRLGGTYETPDKRLSVGLSIIPGTTLKPHSNLRGPVGLEYYGWPEYPIQISMGFAYQFKMSPFKIFGEYKLTPKTNVAKGIFDINLGSEYKLSKLITIRCGGFTNQNTGKFNGQMYLTAGCGVNLSNFNIDAAILDSHISNGPKSTIFQTSVAYGF